MQNSEEPSDYKMDPSYVINPLAGETLFATTIILTLLQVQAALMIADAIRRIWLILRERKDLRKNETIIIVHLTIFIAYLITLIVMWIFFLLATLGTVSLAYYNWSLSITQVFNTLTQLLILHMTFKHSSFLKHKAHR